MKHAVHVHFLMWHSMFLSLVQFCFCFFFLIRFCFKHLHSAKKITVRKRSHKMNDTERCMGLEQDLDTLLSDITCKKNARFPDWGRGRETRLLASLSVLGILGWRRGET